MIREAHTWDKPSFDKLWEATKLAGEAGAPEFGVDLGRKLGRRTFTLAEALDLCETLRHEFDASPMPIFGENREGQEP